MRQKKPLKDTTLTKYSLTSFIKGLVFFVKVEGESAWPELVPEKIYLVTNLLKPRVSDFAVFRNPKSQNEILVKKIKSIKKNLYFVEGNIPWSTSSKNFGPVNRDLILGKILFI